MLRYSIIARDEALSEGIAFCGSGTMARIKDYCRNNGKTKTDPPE